MKVVLLEDVSGLGDIGDVKEVANGYGRNYLLPRSLARVATPSALKDIEARAQKEARKRQDIASTQEKLAEQIGELIISFKEKVATENRTYGSIRDVHIAQEISRLIGQDIDKGCILLKEPIHELGSHEVVVKLNKDLLPTITVVVEEEKEESEQ